MPLSVTLRSRFFFCQILQFPRSCRSCQIPMINKQWYIRQISHHHGQFNVLLSHVHMFDAIHDNIQTGLIHIHVTKCVHACCRTKASKLRLLLVTQISVKIGPCEFGYLCTPLFVALRNCILSVAKAIMKTPSLSVSVVHEGMGISVTCDG